MTRTKSLTINEVARRGGLATAKKYSHAQRVAWGKRGGRPPKNRVKK